jgi:hypothetical protein
MHSVPLLDHESVLEIPGATVGGVAERKAVTGFTVIVVCAGVVAPPLSHATLYVVVVVGVTESIPVGALPVEKFVPTHLEPFVPHVSMVLCPLRIVLELADKVAVTADTFTVVLELTGVPPLSQAML